MASQTEVSLYQLTTCPVEKVLPKLLEKVYDGQMRALVLTDSEERMESLNSSLWTYSPSSFLPHGMDGAGDPQENPVWISMDQTNKNNANVLVITAGNSVEDISPYVRCVDIFDGNNETALSAALTRRANYLKAGHLVAYWKQTLESGWTKEQ